MPQDVTAAGMGLTHSGCCYPLQSFAPAFVKSKKPEVFCWTSGF